MGRHKTISDDDVLRVARDVFRAQGHTASTRAIAEAANISEAVLYQRFGSKDELFFAAMRPSGPDIDELLGPPEPPTNARAYLQETVVRIGRHFASVLPLALRVMSHPSFDSRAMSRIQPGGPTALHDAFAERLAALARRQQLAPHAEAVVARLLVSLAHDWALRTVFAAHAPARRERELKEMVDIVWEGLRP